MLFFTKMIYTDLRIVSPKLKLLLLELESYVWSELLISFHFEIRNEALARIDQMRPNGRESIDSLILIHQDICIGQRGPSLAKKTYASHW